jgi:TraG P-loop domain
MLAETLNQFNLSAFKTRKDYAKASFNLPDSLPEKHIELRDFSSESIVILKNGDLGVIYEINGIYDEVLDQNGLTEKIHSFMKGFRSVGTGIPSHLNLRNTTVQLILKQREIKSPQKNHTYSESTVGKILQQEEKELFKRGLVKKSFYITIRFAPENTTNRSSGFFYHLRSTFIKSQNDQLNQFLQTYETFKNELTNFERHFPALFSLKRLNRVESLAIIQNMLFAGEDHPLYDGEDSIEKTLYAPAYEEERNTLLDPKTGKSISSYHLEQLPRGYSFGRFRHFIDSIPYKNFDLIWIFSQGSKEITKDLIARETFYGRKKTTDIEFQEFVSFRSNVDSQHPHGTQSVRLLIYNPAQDKEGLLESLAQDYIGARLVKESQILTHMFVTSIPLNCRAEANKLKGRTRKIRLENALAFLPLYQGPSDTHGLRHYASRYGTPTRFDLFAGEGNKITSVLGMSRGGKSVLTNNLILEFIEKNPDGIVRIIDVKTSYLKLCDLLGGKIIQFSEEKLKENCYSPFALGESYDMDDIEAIFLLISTAIIQKNPGIKFSAVHTELLREALKIAYNSNLTTKAKFGKLESAPHPVWDDVLASLPQAVTTLTSSGVVGAEVANKDIALWSVNLYQTGQFGFIFNRYENVNEQSHDNKILVYDLDGNNDEVLRQISAMMAFIKITRDLAKLPTSIPKLIIFEEFGILLNGDDEAQKLNEQNIRLIVKTTAKLNAQPIAITNNVDDYSVKPAGVSFWELSTIKIFLPLGSMYENAKKAWATQFNEAFWQILKSLKKEVEFKRSSILVYSENDTAPYVGSFYLILSSFIDALTTSSGSQMNLYKDLKKRGLSPAESLNYMKENHPFGKGL